MTREAVRILIVTSFQTLEGFQTSMENRTLLWALDRANIRWKLYNPWKREPNLIEFDAVFICVYLTLKNNFQRHCKHFEDRCRSLGIPVINTIRDSIGLHSATLAKWHANGIKCARYQCFSGFDGLTLDTYPMILRRDGVHRGNSMFLVNNPEQARKLIEGRKAEADAAQDKTKGPHELNLAIEFIETRTTDNYYCKWRSYVVGDEVIPAHFMRSRTPFVNYKDAALWSQACGLDECFRLGGESHPEIVRKAAKALDLEIMAIDYSVLENTGEYVFWETNRRRATAGDSHVRWLQMRDVDLEFGAAVARLIRKRVSASRRYVDGDASALVL